MKFYAPLITLIIFSSCASSRNVTPSEESIYKETWWLNLSPDETSFLLTWYKFPVSTELVDFFARGPEFYVRLEWNLNDGKIINANNFQGEIIGYMGKEFVISEGTIQVVSASKDYIELKFELNCKVKNGTGAPMAIKEFKRFGIRSSSASTFRFETKNKQIESLPDTLRQLRANTFEWDDVFVEVGNQRVFNAVQDFDGACTSKPCEYYVHNRMFVDSIQHFMFLNPRVKIELGFHTDTRGSESYNTLISEKWAIATKELLMTRGIDEGRISAIGFGETKPLVSDSTIHLLQDKVLIEKIHALNRRFGQVSITEQ